MGALDRRVLDQDWFWVTANATILRLSQMSTAHLDAVVEFLHEQHATRLHLNAMLDAMVELIVAADAGGTTGEVLTHTLCGESIATVDQHAWLESTPLVRAIRRELATRP